MAKKAYYALVGTTSDGKDLYYKFITSTTAYDGLMAPLGIVDALPANSKPTTAGTFASYPELMQVRITFKNDKSIVRIATVAKVAQAASSLPGTQAGPNNALVEQVKFVRQRRRK